MPETAYQNLVLLAAELCKTQFAAIAFVNKRRQYIRAAVGFSDDEFDCLLGLCRHAAKQKSLLIIKNAHTHNWMSDHIMVMGRPSLRYLASASLHTNSENSAGVLCVFDQYQRNLSTQQLNSLTTIAAQAGLIHQLSRSHGKPDALQIDHEIIKKKERQRIARDLHDELGQHLMLLKIDLTLMKKISHHQRIEQINIAVHRIEKAILATRQIIKNLRLPEMESGLLAALKDYLQQYEKNTNIQYQFNCDDFFSEEKLSTNNSLILYRTLQEALTNTIRHANASAVYIRLWNDIEGISLQIIDDGAGIAKDMPVKQLSFGLTGMRERILAANGRIIIGSTPGCGTELLIFLPYEDMPSTQHQKYELTQTKIKF